LDDALRRVAGGLIFGPISDHLGRVLVLTGPILLFGSVYPLPALRRGPRLLAIGFLSNFRGLGLGASSEAAGFCYGGWPSRKARPASSYVGWWGGTPDLRAAFVTPRSFREWLAGMFLVGNRPRDRRVYRTARPATSR